MEKYDKQEKRPDTRPEAGDGYILVDKPKGITSFDVIRSLRRIVKSKKMGHLGTLDPNATGLLPVCIGQATRLSRFMMHADKKYRAIVQLGYSTDSYDAEGAATSEAVQPPALTLDELQDHLSGFIGTIMQTPPVYSAKKVAGKRLYEYAREGTEVEAQPCEVTIHDIEVIRHERELLELVISSSAGMYVRSLAHDLGQKIGCGAFLRDLQRLNAGPFFLEDAFTLDAIEEMAASGDLSFIHPINQMLPDLRAVKANAIQVEHIRNGRNIIDANPMLKNGDLVRVISSDGSLLAIGLVLKPLGSAQNQIQPKVVLGNR